MIVLVLFIVVTSNPDRYLVPSVSCARSCQGQFLLQECLSSPIIEKVDVPFQSTVATGAILSNKSQSARLAAKFPLTSSYTYISVLFAQIEVRSTVWLADLVYLMFPE